MIQTTVLFSFYFSPRLMVITLLNHGVDIFPNKRVDLQRLSAKQSALMLNLCHGGGGGGIRVDYHWTYITIFHALHVVGTKPYNLMIGSEFRVTSHTKLKACDHCILKSLINQKAESIQVHFTLEHEG